MKRISARRSTMLATIAVASTSLLSAAAPFDPFGAATIVERRGAAVPIDALFRDADGRSTSLRRIADGRPILLAPVLHDCPNLCGVTLDGLLDATASLRATDAAIVAMGIDPREGPAAASGDRDRLAARHPGAPAVAMLTGSRVAIRGVTDPIGYRYSYDPRIGQYAHVAAVAVLTPDGRLARWLYGLSPSVEDVRTAVTAARDGQTGGIVDRLILLCYHYDPTQGRYGLAINRVLTAACIATAVALAALVLWLRRRERRTC